MKRVVERLQACAKVDLDDGACMPIPAEGRTSGDEGEAAQNFSTSDKDAQIDELQATIRALRAMTEVQLAMTEAQQVTINAQHARIQTLEQAAALLVDV